MRYSPKHDMTLHQLAHLLRYQRSQMKSASGRRVYTWVIQEGDLRLKVARMPYMKDLVVWEPLGQLRLVLIDQDLVHARLLYRVERVSSNATVSIPWGSP